ncbi:MAG: NUDIX hydrolase, partial [Lachnospiraceae bacterium]|nr:NUDIX hydrolase [Lachnospiraceae bacterium]
MELVKSIKKELVYKGSIIDVYKDHVKMPDGKMVEWDFVDHKGAAAVLPITKDGKVVMVKQYRNALDRITLEIPAGGINPGETPMESAIRELTEETGYISEKVCHLKDMVSAIGFCNETIYIYLAADLKPAKQHLDEDEFVDVVEYPLEEVMDLILTNQIIDGKTIAAVLHYYILLER